MNKLIYGSEVASKQKATIKIIVDDLKVNNKRLPHLAVVIVGDDAASHVYVSSKEKACQQVGFESTIIRLNEQISEAHLLSTIEQLNNDNNVDGILVQMPLPKHLSENAVITKIDPNKDVDGLNPINVGKLHLNMDGFVPCTPSGIMVLLEEMQVDFAGANAVVVGRSKLVGGPVAKLLEQRNCTVTICHSRTKNIEEICSNADILVVAIGKANLVKKHWIKDGAYIIDVGINRIDGKLCGDVDTNDVIEKCNYITPVPKGVGPMTIVMLLQNTLKAYFLKENSHD